MTDCRGETKETLKDTSIELKRFMALSIPEGNRLQSLRYLPHKLPHSHSSSYHSGLSVLKVHLSFMNWYCASSSTDLELL